VKLRRIFILIALGVFFASAVLAQETGSPLPSKEQDIFHLTLKDALVSAVKINFQVMMANARLEQAIARISQAQADLMPHIEGVASTSRQSSDLRAEGIQFPGIGPHFGPYNTFDARGRVTLALFDLSAFERFQSAKRKESLSEVEVQKTREDVLALVATLFIDAQRKQQTVKLIQTLLERDQMAFNLSEDNLSQGLGSILDTNKLKSDLDQTKYLLSQAKLQADDACLDLAAALQLPLDVPMVLVEDKAFQRKLEVNVVNDSTDENSPDRALAASQLEVSKADQKTAKADFLPKVTGTADYGRSGESPEHGSNTYFVGLKATVPLWEGGSQQAKLKETKAKIKEDEASLLDTSQQVQVNIAKAREAIVEADDLRKAKSQECQTAQRSLIIALRSQESGSGSVFEVMLAKAQLALSEDEYNESQAAWEMALIDLLHAQGRLRGVVKKEITPVENGQITGTS